MGSVLDEPRPRALALASAMNPSTETIQWLLDSDPSFKWRVQRDLLGLPQSEWQATKNQTGTDGFGARVLSVQDPDGQWMSGAYFPKRHDDRAIYHDDDDQGQPYTATTWALNALRSWGVDATLLGDTAARLAANSLWEYKDLPYWDGEVDCCINAFTLSNGLWLGLDMAKNAQWFVEHQAADGGWNCEWVEGSTRGSFHSTLNSLIGLLDYEQQTGRNSQITAARKKAEEYLLQRKLMFKLGTDEPVGRWVAEFIAPARWRYSALRALDYFRQSSVFDGTLPDPRLEPAIELVKSKMNQNGRWLNDWVEKGSVWVEEDAPMGQESKQNTLAAIGVLSWWEANRQN